MRKKNIGKPTRWYSDKQEKHVAKVVRGKQVSNSGATAFHKGDVITHNFLIECKTTTKDVKSFSIKREWLDKNEEERFAMNKDYSALAFDFGDSDVYYIINEKLFQQLVTLLEEENYET